MKYPLPYRWLIMERSTSAEKVASEILQFFEARLRLIFII